MKRSTSLLLTCAALLCALVAAGAATATPRRDLDLAAKAGGPNHWHISTYYAANLNGHGPGNRAMWCGDSTLVRCAPSDSMGGLGNGWFDDLVWEHAVPDPGVPVTVRLTGWMNYDLPDITWDWVFPVVMRDGAADELAEYTGDKQDNVFFDLMTVVSPGEFMGPGRDRVQLRLRVTSDGGWSDADCFMLSRGATQIDDITVYFDGEVVTFDDFEDGSPVHWAPLDPAVVTVPPEARFAAAAAPNPFNPSTRIVFELAAAGPVRVRILDVQGRVVRTLLDARRDAGPGGVTWDGRDDAGLAVASGVYFYRVDAGAEARTGKLALVK